MSRYTVALKTIINPIIYRGKLVPDISNRITKLYMKIYKVQSTAISIKEFHSLDN